MVCFDAMDAQYSLVEGMQRLLLMQLQSKDLDLSFGTLSNAFIGAVPSGGSTAVPVGWYTSSRLAAR